MGCFYSKYVLPADWHGNAYKEKAIPRLTLLAPTVYEQIAPMVKGYHAPPENSGINCDATEYECRSAVVFNHYAKGADRWRTMSSILHVAWDTLTGGSAYLMDSTPAYEAKTFVNNYFSKNNPEAKHKRFPALFTVYFAGLDHEAHDKGMDAYRNFFTETTDTEIAVFTKALKDQDEFDNKIFIIVADHGHTAMPTDLTYVYKEKSTLTGDPTSYPMKAEMSCKLKLDFEDPDDPDQVNNAKEAERNNNNLHIWELGEVMKEVGKFTGGNYSYRVLAPEPIAALFSEEAYGARTSLPDANIIAALNGPMAHIYLTDLSNLSKVAEMLRLTMQKEQIVEAAKWFKLPAKGYKDLRSSVGRLKFSIDHILVRQTDATGNGDYCAFDGLNDDGSIICAPGNPFASEEYVSAWDRINGMNHPKRSGDIVLLMKDVVNLPQNEPIGNYRYTTGVACKSWHGSLNRSDSYVPFIFAYPGGNKYEMEKILQRETVCKADYSKCTGNWKLTDTVKDIISGQYK